MSMRRNRNGARKERIIMLASSALVLTALTVTGVFVRSNRTKEEENNVVDFSVIEAETEENAEINAEAISGEEMGTLFTEVGTDDLDYDPYFQEANSGHVENTDLAKKDTETNAEENEKDSEEPQEGMFDEDKEVMTEEEKQLLIVLRMLNKEFILLVD